MNKPLALNPEVDPEWAIAAAQANARRLEAEVPTHLQKAEGQLPSTIQAVSGAPADRLKALHAQSAQVYQAIRPYTACRHQCSWCCHYTVELYPIEVDIIAATIGKAPKTAPNVRPNWHGTACPFLTQAGACGIYDVRPMACRKHVMLTRSSYWCRPDRSYQMNIPLMSLSGVDEAFAEILSEDGRSIPADIRDYF